MCKFNKLTLAAFFALSVISLLAGCGEPPGGQETPKSCTSATVGTDCKAGKEACVNIDATGKGVCSPTCTDTPTDSCGKGKKCTTFKDSNGATTVKACLNTCTGDDNCGKGEICEAGVCQKVSCTSATNNHITCDDTNGRECKDQMCVSKGTQQVQQPKTCTTANVGTVCGSGPLWQCVAGKCQQRPLAGVIIKDLKAPGTCNGKDKGSDIVAVGLQKEDGSFLGWGRNINVGQIVADPANQATAGQYTDGKPDGSAPSVTDTNQCQAKELSKIDHSSTGCGGYLKFAFDTPSPVTLDMGKVNVYEFDGNKCYKGATPPSPAYADDKYEVYGCTKEDSLSSNVSEVENFITANCVKLGNNAAGYTGNNSFSFPPAQ